MMSENVPDHFGESVRNCSCSVAIALGLIDGGLEVITNYPGSYSHDIFSICGGKVTSINERTAFSIAWGASVCGKRSAVTLKNVGLNDAADPFLNAMILDVNAGLVVVVFDDIDIEGSQIRQDSRNYFSFHGGLWFEPTSIRHAYEIARESFRVSERFLLPVVIRFTNILENLTGDIVRSDRGTSKKTFLRKPENYVAHPINLKSNLQRMKNKAEQVADFVEDLHREERANSSSASTIVFGRATHEFYAEPPYLNIFTLPPPMRLIRLALKNENKAVVLEHGDPFVTDIVRKHLCTKKLIHRQLISELSKHSYIVTETHEKMYSALRTIEGIIVCGDIGSYTIDRSRTIDMCLCLGAGVAISVGAAMAESASHIFCVTGDGAFFHSGKSVLCEASERGLTITIVILENEGCKTTGGQKVPGTLKIQECVDTVIHAEYSSTSDACFAAIFKRLSSCPGISLLIIHEEGS
ncbi:hypothetical protein GF413_05790 [Candidatus Micrarchaeota archaeon]|nr:hypothetical protein [Candidatus Micrarchaeota archaeon]